MVYWTLLFAAETAAEEGGGLFDLDATLPLMAIQFLLLTAILNAVLYKPLSQALDGRDEYIRTNQTDARERLLKAERLAQQYEQELGDTRRQAQEVIAAAQTDAKQIASNKMAEAQREAQQKREQAQQELEQQRQEALQSLEQQVELLSNQIFDKVLGNRVTG